VEEEVVVEEIEEEVVVEEEPTELNSAIKEPI
jgi:hypothetical protein